MKKYKIKKMVMGGFAQSEPKLESAYGEGHLTQGAVSGVTTGASLGTKIMPGWGTAIGAAVGGIGGLLMGAGKRRQANREYREQFDKENRDYQFAKSAYNRDMIDQSNIELKNMQSDYDIQSMYRFGGVLPKFLNGGKIPQYQAGGNTDKDPNKDSLKTKTKIIPLGLEDLSANESDTIKLKTIVNQQEINKANNPTWTLVEDTGRNLIDYGAKAIAAHTIGNYFVPNYTGKIAKGLSDFPNNIGFVTKSKAQKLVDEAVNEAIAATKDNITGNPTTKIINNDPILKNVSKNLPFTEIDNIKKPPLNKITINPNYEVKGLSSNIPEIARENKYVVPKKLPVISQQHIYPISEGFGEYSNVKKTTVNPITISKTSVPSSTNINFRELNKAKGEITKIATSSGLSKAQQKIVTDAIGKGGKDSILNAAIEISKTNPKGADRFLAKALAGRTLGNVIRKGLLASIGLVPQLLFASEEAGRGSTPYKDSEYGSWSLKEERAYREAIEKARLEEERLKRRQRYQSSKENQDRLKRFSYK